MTGADRPRGIGRRTVLEAGALLAGGALATGSAGADGQSEAPAVVEGESAAVGDGTATAYAATDAAGELSTLGVHLDDAALGSVDVDREEPHESVAAHLSFPDAVDTHQFTFVGFHYNPLGHPPPDVYTVPHFDFHFYMIEEDVVESIAPGVVAYDLPDHQHPPGYVFERGRPIVPEMGEHLLDATAPEFAGREFTHTYVYGAYDPSIDPENPAEVTEREVEGETREVAVFEGDGRGRLHFVEPMVTAAFLADLDEEIRVGVATPERFFAEDRYPTEYVLRPDRDDGVLAVIDGFRQFSGPSQ